MVYRVLRESAGIGPETCRRVAKKKEGAEIPLPLDHLDLNQVFGY
jgi:hypothetical protein